MTYVVTKRLKSKTLCGEVNLPYGTKLDCQGEFVLYNNRPMCGIKSQNAYDYLSQDTDGQGLKRGELVLEIQRCLAKHDDKHQDRWDVIWDDEAKLGKYRREDHPDFWLWNFDFYNAPIEDLEYILNKIKEVK